MRFYLWTIFPIGNYSCNFAMPYVSSDSASSVSQNCNDLATVR